MKRALLILVVLAAPVLTVARVPEYRAEGRRGFKELLQPPAANWKDSLRMLDICPARPEDHPFLRALYVAVWETTPMAAALPEAQRAAIAQLQFDAQEQAYARAFPGAERGIIRDGQEPIGCLWTHRTDEEIRLIDIRLLPVRQGRGHGTVILRKLLEEAERSRRPVRLQVEYINPALRLYGRLGFRETRRGDVHVEMEWLSESRP